MAYRMNFQGVHNAPQSACSSSSDERSSKSSGYASTRNSRTKERSRRRHKGKGSRHRAAPGSRQLLSMQPLSTRDFPMSVRSRKLKMDYGQALQNLTQKQIAQNKIAQNKRAQNKRAQIREPNGYTPPPPNLEAPVSATNRTQEDRTVRKSGGRQAYMEQGKNTDFKMPDDWGKFLSDRICEYRDNPLKILKTLASMFLYAGSTAVLASCVLGTFTAVLPLLGIGLTTFPVWLAVSVVSGAAVLGGGLGLYYGHLGRPLLPERSHWTEVVSMTNLWRRFAMPAY